MLGVRCGSPATNGTRRLLDPFTAQLLEPLASGAHPIALRPPACSCSAIAIPSPDPLFLGDDPGSGRVGRVEPRRELRAEARAMSARSSSRSQLVAKPSEISLPRVRTSTGRHGSNRSRRSCISNRQSPRRGAGGGIHPVAEVLDLGEEIGVESAHLGSAARRNPSVRISRSTSSPSGPANSATRPQATRR